MVTERFLTLSEAAAILHMNREEARHALGLNGAGILRSHKGLVIVPIAAFVAWRKETM